MGGVLSVKQITESSNTFTGTNVEWSSGTFHAITLTGNKTLTFTGAVAGQSITLAIGQDGTGSRLITWPTIRWGTAGTPVLTTTANKVDFISIRYDGSDYFGFYGGAGF